MKEIPMLMSAPMVRSLRAWNKTMTRREVKSSSAEMTGLLIKLNIGIDVKGTKEELIRCCSPYGHVGDRLWVRENWQPWGYAYQDEPEFLIKYPADGGFMQGILDTERDLKYSEMIDKEAADRDIEFDENYRFVGDECPLKERPSIHLWKEFSRIWLAVTELRIERLQDIKKPDALLEGIKEVRNVVDNTVLYESYREGHPTTSFPTHAYQTLWEKLNGKDSWKSNPWVWVIGFKILSVTGKDDIGKGRKELQLL